ncbi:MAG: peptidoglycan-binding protein [Inquilinaceae bacterium]
MTGHASEDKANRASPARPDADDGTADTDTPKTAPTDEDERVDDVSGLDRQTSGRAEPDVSRALERLNERLDRIERDLSALSRAPAPDPIETPASTDKPPHSVSESDPDSPAPATPARPSSAPPAAAPAARVGLSATPIPPRPAGRSGAGGDLRPPQAARFEQPAGRPERHPPTLAPSPGPATTGPRPAPGGARPTTTPDEPRRQRRWVFSGVFWLIVLAVIGAGGWWIYADPDGAAIRRDALIAGVQRLAGREPPAQIDTAAVPPASETAGLAQVDPEAEAAETVNPPPGTPTAPAGEDTPPIDESPATTSDADPAVTEGPAVPAVPTPTVEIASVPEPEGDLAPLPANASEELRSAAEMALAGNPEAQHDLATVYALGRLVPQDFARAAYWYERSAQSGVLNARYNLGVLTKHGMGVPENAELAFAQYKIAAEGGHTDAQIVVGLAYVNGDGVEADPLQAAPWFQAASAKGDARGAYHLGELFENGLDGAPDLAAAAGWYRIAADAGMVEAQEALTRVTAGGASTPSPTGDTAAPAVPVPATTPDPVPPAAEPAPPLDAAAIQEIQELLAAAGYSPGTPDGVVGTNTRTAIQNFETDNKLPPTGQPSTRLLELLRQQAPEG